MIQFVNKQPGQKVLELGGGEHPHPAADVNVDVRPGPTVSFPWDFESVPWPLADDEWDFVISTFLLEHLSWRKVAAALAEVFRVTKPGGSAVFALPNTEEQVNWLRTHPGGWDGRGFFESASCVLFGDQDYSANSHRGYFSPVIAEWLFREAGFEGVTVEPYGARHTDMVVRAAKPITLREKDLLPGTLALFPGAKFQAAPCDPLPVFRPIKSGDQPIKSGDQVPHFIGGGPAGVWVFPEAAPPMVYSPLGNPPNPMPTRSEGEKAGTPLPAAPEPRRNDPGANTGEDKMDKIGKMGNESVEIPEAWGVSASGGGISAANPQVKITHVGDGIIDIEGPIEPKPQGVFYVQSGDLQLESTDRADMFDKVYFNGGQKVGGYACDKWGAYRDFPVHEITARHLLTRKPESVLELGCARGYVIKRIQDAGVTAQGLEVSKHCIMTRVANQIIKKDLCQTPWPFTYGKVPESPRLDLCFSIATLEHVPEPALPAVIAEMARTCKRGLHGIDFGGADSGFDKTHCTLRPKSWWEAMFAEYAPGWPVEVLDKEELERGEFPKDVLEGDGKVKLNVGSHIGMAHHGWTNIDANDLSEYAAQNGYRFQRHDVRAGLPFGTGAVDLIFASHFVEHLSYRDGLAFLRECRRVLKPDGALRLVCPDARLLSDLYTHSYESAAGFAELQEFDEINDGCAAAPTAAGKLWALLHEGHLSAYDCETLQDALLQAGFFPYSIGLRATGVEPCRQILRETAEMGYGLSLFMDAVPKTG